MDKPAEEKVLVVRCGQCGYKTYENGKLYCGNPDGGIWGVPITPHDYCSNGCVGSAMALGKDGAVQC